MEKITCDAFLHQLVNYTTLDTPQELCKGYFRGTISFGNYTQGFFIFENVHGGFILVPSGQIGHIHV